MTPNSRHSGLRITGLTLALLKDTGFYERVDDGLSEATMWGKGKGCGFARGDIGGEDPCRPNTCDYYSKYVRSCTQQNVEYTESNWVCED